MTTTDDKQSREDRALDTLIVLALRSEPDYDTIDIDIGTLPELSDEDRAAMESLGTPEEFIARMMRIADERAKGAKP